MNFYEFAEHIFTNKKDINELSIQKMIDILLCNYDKNKNIFIIGNGGSAANASHFAQDLSKGTRISLMHNKRIKAISLTDNVSFITAIANDDGYGNIFTQQLLTYSNDGDTLIAISGSGNSINIINAVSWANRNRLTTIGITGFDGGKLREMCQLSIHVPQHNMFVVEIIHLMILHYITLKVRESIK